MNTVYEDQRFDVNARSVHLLTSSIQSMNAGACSEEFSRNPGLMGWTLLNG